MNTQSLTNYLDQLANNKPRFTRELITNARIERYDALMRWMARDWLSYHRTYFCKGFLTF